MTNYRNRFQNNLTRKLGNVEEFDKQRKKDLFDTKGFKAISPQTDSIFLTEAESERFVKAYIKQKTRYIPKIDYKNPESFCFFGSAEKYYEDSIKNIYNTYPYDGSKAEKMEWSLSASYLDLYIFEHDYPKSAGHISFVRSTVTVDGNPYQTVETPRYIEFFGGPQKNTIYSSSKNRESNLKIDGTTGNTVEFWLKKNSDSWCSTARKEIVLDVASTSSAGSNLGRLTIELENPSNVAHSPFMFTYRSGSTGTSATGLRLGSTSVTKASVGDGKWHHYAISAQTSGSVTVFKLYVDGRLDHTTTGAYTLGPIKDFLNGTLGSTEIFGNGAGAEGLGQLSASLDEFRYWKTARSEKEIGRFWYQPIHGGTDADHTNADLGVYYKFNEGIVGSDEHDKVILDYSGRINNGTFVNYHSSARSTVSGIESSIGLPEADFKEVMDPIINPLNSLVESKLASLKNRGKSHDIQNQASLINTVPEHFRSQDTNLFPELLQILASTFDDLFLKIKMLPMMKDTSYNDFFKESGQYRLSKNNNFLLGCEEVDLVEFTGNNYKPWTKNILEHFGLVSSDVFSNATIFERFFNRSEELTFEHNIEEVKRAVLSNIHKNLVNILKTKGTESSFRNLIRCFGIDDELVRFNIYSQNAEQKLELNPIYSSIKQKALSFEGQNYQGTVYQQKPDSDSSNYISGSSVVTPFMLEANVIFPLQPEGTAPRLQQSSLFGIHSVSDSNKTAEPLKFHSEDSGSFQAYFHKRTQTSKEGYFVLTSSAGVIQSVSSSFIPAVYDNSHWNISIRIGTKGDIEFGSMPENNATPYYVTLTGYNYDLDVLKNSFEISSSLSREDYVKISQQNKAVFLGSHKTDFSGSHQMSSDIRVLSFNTWRDCLSDDELKEHAKNPRIFGRTNPDHVSNFDTGNNLSGMNSLILRWQFQNLTGSDSSGQMTVEDYTSGSAADPYNDGIIGLKYTGLATGFVKQSDAISQEFISAVKYNSVDSVYSSDEIKIKSQELEKFEPDSRPITHLYSFEKSMYQVVSEEMVNFFAGMVGYNNLIGEPVNKYRHEYKAMEKVRDKFFSNVSNNIDLERFVDYYRWIDSSLSDFLFQLVPASANFAAGIKDVVESHILERNKYKHQPPTIEFKDPADKTFSILGINELLYDWEHGHFSADENENCLWRKERSPRSGSLETLRRISVTEVDGSTYALRRLVKPYKITGLGKVPIGTGLNRNSNHNPDLYKAALTANNKIQLTASTLTIQDGKVCKDVLDPSETKLYHGPADVSSTAGYLDGDSDLILPFTMVSSSGIADIPEFHQNLTIANNHIPMGRTGEVPLRGPFARSHIGMKPHNRVALGTLDHNRPEAYSLTLTSSISSSGGPAILSQKAARFTSNANSYIEIPDDDQFTPGPFSGLGSAATSRIQYAFIAKVDMAEVSSSILAMGHGINEPTAFNIAHKGTDQTDTSTFEWSFGISYFTETALTSSGFAADDRVRLKWQIYTQQRNEDDEFEIIHHFLNEGSGLDFSDYVHVVIEQDYAGYGGNNITVYAASSSAGSMTSLTAGHFLRNTPGSSNSTLPTNTTSPVFIGKRIGGGRDSAINSNTSGLRIGQDVKFVGDIATFAIWPDNNQNNINNAAAAAFFNTGSISNLTSSANTWAKNVRAWYLLGDRDDTANTSAGIKDYSGNGHHATSTNISFVNHGLGSATYNTPTVHHSLIISGALNVTEPASDVPKSRFFSHIEAAAHVNIRNIKHDTGSLLLGNYNKIHEIVRTSGRSINNAYLQEVSGDYINANASGSSLQGFVDAPMAHRPRFGHVIVNRFSAPGGPETAGAFANDIESGELSIYNTVNYRNLNKRNLLNRLYSEKSDQFGLRSGTVTGSIHKSYRNPLRTTGSSEKQVEHDNFFISHHIPTHDFSYSWITASANEDVYSFLNKNENYGHQHTLGRSNGSTKSSATINFLMSADRESGVPNLDFAQMNYYATSSLNTETRILSYSAGTTLNSQILNKQGPYGWPSWKQIRTGEHKMSRYEKKQNIISVSNRVVADPTVSTNVIFPSPIQIYEWSSNPRLSDLDDNTVFNRDRGTLSFTEVLATNRFNPLTITLHGERATDLTTETLTQQQHQRYWNNDETSLVSLGENADRTLRTISNTRLASIKSTYANKKSNFANPKLNEKLRLNQNIRYRSDEKLLRGLSEISINNPYVYTTEVNYIETLYPRELNTFTKISKIREKFDFFGWKKNDTARKLQLGGTITYTSCGLQSGSVSMAPGYNTNNEDYKKTNKFGADAVEASSLQGLDKEISNIKSSVWPLDARSIFTGTPASLTSSYYNKKGNHFNSKDLGTRNEGVLQNDYNTFACGYNLVHGAPPASMLYNRRIPQPFLEPAAIVRGPNLVNRRAVQMDLGDASIIKSGTNSTPNFSFHTSSAKFTLSAWINITGTVGSGTQTLIHFGDSTNYTDLQYWLFWDPSDRAFHLRLDDASGTDSLEAESSALATFGNHPTGWHHVVATFDDGGSADSGDHTNIKIYVNGELDTNSSAYNNADSWAGLQAVTNDTLSIGGVPGVSTQRVEGQMSDVAIFSGRALTAAEVTELYSDGKVIDIQRHSRFSDAVVWLKMGDGPYDNGTDYFDYVGNRTFTGSNAPIVDFVEPLPTEREIIKIENTNQEYLAGEAQWLAASQTNLYPFPDTYDEATEGLRNIAQDHSLVPEFKISDHVEHILNNEGGNFAKCRQRDNFLTLTGSIYDKSSQEISIGSNFYKTFATSDFMKYFEPVRNDLLNEDLGQPTKITLRCKAALKFVPYTGFYPAERVSQIGHIFSRGYMNSPKITTHTPSTNDFVLSPQKGIETKIRANLQQSIKPLMAPGILLNSIKSGLAVDYPLFGSTAEEAKLVNYKTTTRDRNVEQYGFDTNNLPSLTYMTGTIVNNTADEGIPRLSGSVYKRVTFEELLQPELLDNVSIIDQEPHPSASIYYGDRMITRVFDYPFKFARLNKSNNSLDLLVSDFSTKRTIQDSLKPYRLAIQNFCAETVNFFLKDSAVSSLESKEVFPSLKENVSYKMRVYVRNNNTRMYDRHSAFGPPVDEGDLPVTDIVSKTVTTAATAASASISNPLNPSTGHKSTSFISVDSTTYTPSTYATLAHFSITASNSGDLARVSVFNPDSFSPWTHHSVAQSSMLLTHGKLGFGAGLNPSLYGNVYVHSSSASNINIYLDMKSVENHGSPANALLNLAYLSLFYYSNEYYGYLDINSLSRADTELPVGSGTPLTGLSVSMTQRNAGTAGNTIMTPGHDIDKFFDIPSAFAGGAAAGTTTELTSSVLTISASHAFSPFVPPYLDPNSSPYVEISFTPIAATGGSKQYTLPEILENATYTYVNFDEVPDNATDNTNYKHSMALSASIDFDKFVIYDVDTAEPGTTRAQRLRWLIQPKWETPVLNFIDATGSALNLDTKLVESVEGKSPWQKRQWSNFYTSEFTKTDSTKYLTSSLGMWHQSGALPSGQDESGYTLSVEPCPGVPDSKQLGYILGFATPGTIASTRLGEIQESREFSEAVIAIPFIEPRAGEPMEYFEIEKTIIAKARRLNRKREKEYLNSIEGVERSVNSPERSRYFQLRRRYDELFNTPGQTAVESVAYQLRMMDKYILPPQFDYAMNVRNSSKPMMYIFQFNAEFSKQDLSNIWQNLPPISSRSAARIKYSSISKSGGLSGKVSDVQYVSNFLDAVGQTGLGPFDSRDLLANKRVRWLVLKVKQRAEFDLARVRTNSAPSIISEGKKIDKTLANIKPSPELLNQKYSYNWPYDFFSLVELVKLESKVDFFKYASVDTGQED